MTEAQALASLFERYAIDHKPDGWPAIRQIELSNAAAELRRLDAVNAQLLEALKEAADEIEHWGAYAGEYFQQKYDLPGEVKKVRAAIAAATGDAP